MARLSLRVQLPAGAAVEVRLAPHLERVAALGRARAGPGRVAPLAVRHAERADEEEILDLEGAVLAVGGECGASQLQVRRADQQRVAGARAMAVEEPVTLRASSAT